MLQVASLSRGGEKQYSKTTPTVSPELCEHTEEEEGKGMPSPPAETREVRMKYALLPDLTQASPRGGLRLLLTVDLGSTMRLFLQKLILTQKFRCKWFIWR